MGRGKLKMELIANEKLRCITFRNRQKGLKKKLQELSTLCDVEACMIMYCDQNGNGTYSSQPDVWPENHYEVQRIVNKYMKEDHGKRTVDLSDILESRKRKAELELQKLREKNGETKGQTSRTGLELDGLSYENLMEINDQLDRKLEHVMSLIDLKKGEAGLMSKTPVNSSHIPGLPTAEQAFQGIEMFLYDLDFPDTSSGVVESDLNPMMMMNMENSGYPEFGSGKASSSELLHHNTQFQDPIHCDPAHGMFTNNPDPSTSYQKMGTDPTMQEMSVSENPMMFNTHPTNSMPQMGLPENMMFDMDHSISMQQISAYRQYLLDGYLFFHS
ncbi:MADS-box transcription factor PHERES 2 [Vitis vinifera]|uniref:MADS-box transcription factor PHERES 2 n=1 Tax=Vitis vinifera TaxID=29760 RepID=A0A438EZM3_VITVI|nr:MADS-box transcription factor PHERES 2 [Vitis vinifera]RVX18671.1 MADS-box transcription factor PHERES 2 [Vitis vinifera]